MKQIRFTKQGFEKLKEEYKKLKEERPDAVLHLKKSRDLGDLSENGYYKASKAKLSSIDRRMMQIKYSLRQAVVIDDKRMDKIGIGSLVVLESDGKTLEYEICGDLEANPSEGKISLLSPLGRALEGKAEGQTVVIKTPKGERKYKILNIS